MKPTAGRRIAVTGATGLVGMNLVRAFASAAGPVRCLVRPASNLAHLSRWQVEPRIVDFASADALARSLDGVDVLIHAAYDGMQLDRLRVEPLVRAASAAGLRHFVYFSTSAVHAIHEGTYGLEETDAVCLDDPYSRFKYEEEESLARVADLAGIGWTVLRPGNVYGPWDLKGFMFRWFETAANGSPFLAGRGRNRIHLCHVDNLVDVVRRVLSTEAARGQVFLVADERASEMRAIWRCLSAAYGRDLKHLALPLALVAQLRRITSRWRDLSWSLDLPPKLGALSKIDYELSIRKAERLLGYRPEVDLVRGIRSTAEWYQSFGLP